MKLLPQKGSDFIEEWVGEDGVLRRTIGRVSKLNEPHHVELVWRDEDWPAETLVVVTFSEKSGSTQVVLVHSGWGNLALPQLNEVKRSHIAGWNYHLAMLKAAVEAE